MQAPQDATTASSATNKDASADADGLFDEFAELPARRHLPLLTRGLLLGLLVVIAFSGGVLVQRNRGTTSGSAATGLPAGLGAGGSPGGGFPGSGTATSGGSSSGAAGTTTTAPTTPVLIGTLVSVSGSDITVKDFGGATHVVHVTGSAAIVVSSPIPLSSLKTGATVSVTGTKAADGSVSATGVTTK